MKLDLIAIGDFIRELRRKAGITQAELAERLGVSFQAVSNWERGESLPDTALLPDLACILDSSIDTILSSGSVFGRYRRRITVAQMREAVDCFVRIRQLIGPDHFVFRTIADALNTRMNTEIEACFEPGTAQDAFILELLLGCVRDGGDYADINDVKENIASDGPKEYTVRRLGELGIK